MSFINNLNIKVVSTWRLLQISRKLSRVDNFSKQQILDYFNRACSEPASSFEKLQFLNSFSRPDQYWIETGTYLGYTSRGLSSASKHVYSLEPSPHFFTLSTKELSDLSNVSVINSTSEDGLLSIFEMIPTGSVVNLWLDGHYSAGGTFLSANKCPIPFELEVLASLKSRYIFRIFIDE
jgi:hypothetical protein